MTASASRTLSAATKRQATLALLLGGLLSACGSTTSTTPPTTTAPTTNFAAVKVSFRPATAVTPLPAGYTANTGTAYDVSKVGTSGNAGWITQDSAGTGTPVALDLSPNTRDRGTSTGAAAEQSTFILMQVPAANTGVKTPGAFEYDVPNGTYTVTASVGDAGTAVDSTNVININGAPLVPAFTPDATTKFKTGSTSVTVTNKMLVFDAKGGVNSKLNYVTITQTSAAAQ